MALFHCMVRHGTVRYGSLLGGFPLGTVPGNWYFLVPNSVEVHASRTVTKTWHCKLCWSLIGLRESSLLRHWTCDTRPSSTALPARFKSAQPAKDRTQLLFKQTHILPQPQNSSVVSVEEEQRSLVHSRGADPARAWWHDAEGKSLMYNVTFDTCYIFRVCFLFIFLPLYLCFASIKNNLIE